VQRLLVFWVFLKVVVPHEVSLKQLIFSAKKKRKYVPVVSEALIGEGKNLGRIFFISLTFCRLFFF